MKATLTPKVRYVGLDHFMKGARGRRLAAAGDMVTVSVDAGQTIAIGKAADWYVEGDR